MRQAQNHLTTHANLLILSQAITDVLRFELGLPLDGIDSDEEAEDEYMESLEYISKYPTLIRRLRKDNKAKWLEELENARN